jgi:hypothetical protein
LSRGNRIGRRHASRRLCLRGIGPLRGSAHVGINLRKETATCRLHIGVRDAQRRLCSLQVGISGNCSGQDGIEGRAMEEFPPSHGDRETFNIGQCLASTPNRLCKRGWRERGRRRGRRPEIGTDGAPRGQDRKHRADENCHALAASERTATARTSNPEGFDFFASAIHGATDLTIPIRASCFAHGALAPQPLLSSKHGRNRDHLTIRSVDRFSSAGAFPDLQINRR